MKEADRESIKDNDEEKELESVVIEDKKNGDYTFEQVELTGANFIMKNLKKRLALMS